MGSVAAACKVMKHHPEWSNTYNSVFVRWTTHNPVGLSSKDVKMAVLCGELAKRPESFALTEIEDSSKSIDMGNLADEASLSGKECCARGSI